MLDRRLELPLTSKLVRTAREVPVLVVTETPTQVELLAKVPPSVLPDISPSRGEISAPMSLASTTTEMLVEAGSRSESISPPEGEMSGRTEGVSTQQVPKKQTISPAAAPCFKVQALTCWRLRPWPTC